MINATLNPLFHIRRQINFYVPPHLPDLRDNTLIIRILPSADRTQVRVTRPSTNRDKGVLSMKIDRETSLTRISICFRDRLIEETLRNHVEGVAKFALPLLLLLAKTVSLPQELFSCRPYPKGVNKR